MEGFMQRPWARDLRGLFCVSKNYVSLVGSRGMWGESTGLKRVEPTFPQRARRRRHQGLRVTGRGELRWIAALSC
jgi:hypothetical protein